MPLHLSKVALGAATVEEVLGWFRDRDAVMRHPTRFRPKREAELVGGSLYWIVKHRLVLRTPIIGFEEAEGGRTTILLSNRAVPVVPAPKRAHQGWRYLEEGNAPPDLDGEGVAQDLPPALLGELRALGLI